MAPVKDGNAGAFAPCLPKRPYFFRVLIPNPSVKVHIPQHFMKHLDGEQHKKVTLLSPIGKFWNIDLHKEGNDLYLDGGWSDFAEEHDLRTGYFVVFRYEGNMLFTVKVFDETCCLKEYELVSCESHDCSSTSNESSEVECLTLSQSSSQEDEAQCNGTPLSKKRKPVEISRGKTISPTTSPSKKSRNDLAVDLPNDLAITFTDGNGAPSSKIRKPVEISRGKINSPSSPSQKSQNDLAEDSPSYLSETLTDGVPEGINDLAKNLVPKQSKSRVEASILEATKNDKWMGNASCVRDNDGLKNLGVNPDQFPNPPDESTNSNSQQYSVFKSAAFTAGTVIDNHTECINDISKASVPMSSSELSNVEIDTAPGTSGLCTRGTSISDGTSVFCKGNFDKLHLTPTARKSRLPRTIKFQKCDDCFHAGPSSLAEKTLQHSEFSGSGMESITAADVTEAATVNSDCNHLESESDERLRDEEKTSWSGATLRRRIKILHKRILEEGGLPDGTVLAYRLHNKVLLTGVKQGNAIKCDCHNYELGPSKFEAHAGQGQKRHPYRNIYNSDGRSLHELSLELPGIPRSSSDFPIKN